MPASGPGFGFCEGLPLTTTSPLVDLGWAPDFLRQIDPAEIGAATPCRISAVHRSRVDAIGEAGTTSLIPPPGLSTAEIAVGDWALADGQRLLRLLDRRTCLARRAAGKGAGRQLIAANVDTMFIVTSCNADFNAPRIERYLALAMGAGVEPVILLTKADLCDDPEIWRQRAASIDGSVAVQTLGAGARCRPDARPLVPAGADGGAGRLLRRGQDDPCQHSGGRGARHRADPRE